MTDRASPQPVESNTDQSRKQITSVAIIGSFRKHYTHVQQTRTAFLDAGLEVTSPQGSRVVNPDDEFVRFATDPDHCTDAEIQTNALVNIFQADFVYVIAPLGYIGRTTCYEIGRLIQACRPLYFSEEPNDLSLRIPQDRIVSIRVLCNEILAGSFEPRPLYRGENVEHS